MYCIKGKILQFQCFGYICDRSNNVPLGLWLLWHVNLCNILWLWSTYNQGTWTDIVPYFTDYKTHFFFEKLPPKFRCVLYSKLKLKCPVFDLKFLPVLKMAIYSMLRETYLYLATLDSTGGSSAHMQRIWVAGIHKLANTVSLPPRHHKPRTMSSLFCFIAVYGIGLRCQ